MVQEELDLILVVLDALVGKFITWGKKGTIVVYGQQEGDEEERLIWCNLKEGNSGYGFRYLVGRDAPRLGEVCSDDIVREAVEDVFARRNHPMRMGAESLNSDTLMFDRNSFWKSKTGIYYKRSEDDYEHEKITLALVLNTMCGRFVAGMNAGPVERHSRSKTELEGSSAVLTGLVEALAQIDRGDRILLHSVEELRQLVCTPRNDLEEAHREAVKLVRRMISKQEKPEIEVWRKWRDANNELPVFFDFDKTAQ